MTKIHPDLARLAAARAENLDMLNMPIILTLTCDVIGDLEINKIRFRSTVFPGLSNAS